MTKPVEELTREDVRNVLAKAGDITWKQVDWIEKALEDMGLVLMPREQTASMINNGQVGDMEYDSIIDTFQAQLNGKGEHQ